MDNLVVTSAQVLEQGVLLGHHFTAKVAPGVFDAPGLVEQLCSHVCVGQVLLVHGQVLERPQAVVVSAREAAGVTKVGP